MKKPPQLTFSIYFSVNQFLYKFQIHFEEEMWNSNVGGENILKLNAIPSLFLHGEAIKSWVTLDNSSINDLE